MTAMRPSNDQVSVQRDLVIGVDVGGTTVKAALIGSDGLEHGHSERPTPRHLGPDAVIATTIRAIVESRAQVPEDARLRAVGLVVPGIVDTQQGIAVYAANLGWRELPIRQIVAEAVGFQTPLTVQPRIYGADLNTLLALVRSILDEVNTAIIVGHNPGFEELAGALAGNHDQEIRLPTSGLALLEFDVERWDAAREGTGRLREVASPRSISST